MNEEDKPDRRPSGRPPIGDRAMTNAEHLRKHYAKRTADKPRRHCTQCDRRLRIDSIRHICKVCWRKTDEGKEYMRLMKIKSREKQS